MACPNCNSCKSNKAVNIQDVLLPDRDNTFNAYDYEDDGSIVPSTTLNNAQRRLAMKTLALVGLDKPAQSYRDSNNELVSLDRTSQRMEVIAQAEQSLKNYLQSPSKAMEDSIVMFALSTGYFSIWMRVFDACQDMKLRFIKEFKGTLGSGCFDMTTAAECCPAPNPDGLIHGGKV